ncbi:MAG TPA: arylesterase [Vicinamibacterales bacterium]|nr:arylesterase [Vicinamibacterales bacterium]
MTWSRSLLFAAVAVLLLACGSAPNPAEPGEMTGPPPVVVVLGDSLTAGPGLRPEEAYPAILQRKARDAGYPHLIVNAGVSGDTTADALRRLDRALEPDARVLVIALGANDGLRHVPIAQVRNNLKQIIERARGRGIRMLLCGMETPPHHGWQYTIDFHRIFPGLASEYGIPLMPFLLTGVVGNPDLNLPDGVHPNAAGMRAIADAMWPYLEPLLR